MKKLAYITFTIILSGVLFTSCSKEEGCTDPAATNFNIEAETDDGSCIYEEVEEPTADTTASITLNFNHHFDGLPVSSSSFNAFNYVTANNDTISISKLRYLISDIKLYTLSGDSISLGSYRLVDLTDPNTLSYTIGSVDLGSYAAIGFNFGFDTLDNMGNYTDLNAANWNWPTMIGGGYHNMQFEGRYKFNGNDSTYAYHNGTASNMGNHHQNHIAVRLNGVSLNESYVSINIDMNLAEWFKNPNLWDLNAMHSALMMNYNAQIIMHQNGYNVFSLGNITQR